MWQIPLKGEKKVATIGLTVGDVTRTYPAEAEPEASSARSFGDFSRDVLLKKLDFSAAGFGGVE